MLTIVVEGRRGRGDIESRALSSFLLPALQEAADLVDFSRQAGEGFAGGDLSVEVSTKRDAWWRRWATALPSRRLAPQIAK